MKENGLEYLNFRTRLMKVAKNFQSQLTWVESNSKFLENLPHKTARGLKIEMALLEFCRKDLVRLSNEIEKTLENV